MECQNEREDYATKVMVTGREMYLSSETDKTCGWIETDDDCAQFCRYLGSEGYEFVQINRYVADSDFYTVSHGTVCCQDYFMDQIDSILNSYGYQDMNDGSIEARGPVLDSQLIAEMVFETYFKEFEEDGVYADETAAQMRVKDIINVG